MDDKQDEFEGDEIDQAEEKRRRESLLLTVDLHVTIPMTQGEREHLERLSVQHDMSIQDLVNLAVLNMLLEDQRGEFTTVLAFQKWEPIHQA